MTREDRQLRGVVPPMQRRSQQAVERILVATDGLMSTRPFKELTVQDICLAADVSPSSFYARFATKEHVLIALFELHSDRARSEAEAVLAEVVERSDPHTEIIRELTGHFVRFVRRNWALIASIHAEPDLTDK